MSTFDERDRFETYEEVLSLVRAGYGWIAHILKNGEGDFSIMMHINCEWCDYCEAAQQARKLGLIFEDGIRPIHRAKRDPYANQK